MGVCVRSNLKTEEEMEVACKSMFLRELNELNQMLGFFYFYIFKKNLGHESNYCL